MVPPHHCARTHAGRRALVSHHHHHVCTSYPQMSKDKDLQDYVVVQREEVIEAMGAFVAAYLANLPETQKMDPQQLQLALQHALKVRTTMRVTIMDGYILFTATAQEPSAAPLGLGHNAVPCSSCAIRCVQHVQQPLACGGAAQGDVGSSQVAWRCRVKGEPPFCILFKESVVYNIRE